MIFYDINNNPIEIVEAIKYRGIESLPQNTEQGVMPFSVNVNIPFGSYTLPQYSKGIMVCSGNDAILLAVDPSGDLYTAFRNTRNWGNYQKK
jgi:hypothetical protein